MGFLHGPANHVAVALQVSNDLVLGQERELALLPTGLHTPFQQFPDRPKTVHLVAERHFARPVDLVGIVAMGQ